MFLHRDDTCPCLNELKKTGLKSGCVFEQSAREQHVFLPVRELHPERYLYVSAFLDANDNGKWDTGDYDADLQPEDVFYYNREIECKEKWDITQSWNLTGTPRFRQKPSAITKQKPDADKKLKNRNADRAKKLGIPYNKDKIVKIKSEK